VKADRLVKPFTQGHLPRNPRRAHAAPNRTATVPAGLDLAGLLAMFVTLYFEKEAKPSQRAR